MGIFDIFAPKVVTPAYLDPMVWQHAIAITIVGVFFLALAVIMLVPKVPLPNWKIRFGAMTVFILIGVAVIFNSF